MLIDDFSDKALVSKLTTRWRAVSDKVMGGLSEPSISHAIIDGHTCMRVIGNVRLENGGGLYKHHLISPRRGRLLMRPTSVVCALWFAGMRNNTRFISVPQIMSGLGSPTGFTSLRSRNGRLFNYHSKNFYPIGSTPRWQRVASPSRAGRHWTSVRSRPSCFRTGLLYLGNV